MNFESYISDTETSAKPAKKRNLWAWLSTMQVAIIILIVLGALSLASLFVGELRPAEAVAKPPTSSFAAVGRLLLVIFQMDDPFRSWWYRLLIATLCLSLFACVLERTPIVWRLWRKRPPSDTNWLQSVPRGIVRQVTTTREKFVHHLGVGWSWRLKSEGVWVAERGRLGMWGPLFTHTGMLLIGIGALVGSFGGLQVRRAASAGETVELPDMPFVVRMDSFRVAYYPLQPGQWVKVNDEWVGRLQKKQTDGSWLVERSAHGNETEAVSVSADQIRNRFDPEMDRTNIQRYTSYVTVIENGKEVGRREIAVNSPLRRAGYRFYQSSYDPDNPRVAATYDFVTLTITDTSGQAVDSLRLKAGIETAIPNDTLRVTAGELLPHFKLGRDFRAFSETAEFVNPAVQLTFRGPHGFEKPQWIFLKFPAMEAGPGRFSYRVASLNGERVVAEMATIFDIQKTFGGEFLWAGFLAGTLGLLLSFYIFHRVLYVEWPSEERRDVRITGLTRKTTALYARQLDRFVERLT